MRQRELTSNEQRAVDLCKIFERAIDRGHNTVSLWTSEEAVTALQKLEIRGKKFRILAFQWDGDRKQYKVTWTLLEFEKYLYEILSVVRLTLMVDGSLRTHDGLTITNEYTQ